MARHSKLLSPSGSGRWLRCLGSSAAIAKLNIPETTSEAAERGSLCHDAAEALFTGSITGKPTYITDDEWLLVKKAVKWVNDYIEGLNDESIVIFTEQQLEFDGEFADCFGTADIIGYSPVLQKMFVIDYKFGYGTVLAMGNSQMKIYGLQALDKYFYWEPVEIDLIIAQPKINDQLDIAEMSIAELEEWGDQILKPKMLTVLSGDAPLTPGPHCEQYYCPARGRCAAEAAQVKDMMDDFIQGESVAEPDDLQEIESGFYMSDEQLADMYENWVPLAKSFIKSLETVIVDRLKEGASLPCSDGPLKLVRGKADRVWVDQEKAQKYLKGKGLARKMYNQKFVSPAQAEKLMADFMSESKRVKDFFYGLVTKGEGKLTFAKASDKREAIIWNEPLKDSDAVDDLTLDETDVDLFE